MDLDYPANYLDLDSHTAHDVHLPVTQHFLSFARDPLLPITPHSSMRISLFGFPPMYTRHRTLASFPSWPVHVPTHARVPASRTFLHPTPSRYFRCVENFLLASSPTSSFHYTLLPHASHIVLSCASSAVAQLFIIYVCSFPFLESLLRVCFVSCRHCDKTVCHAVYERSPRIQDVALYLIVYRLLHRSRLAVMD